MEEDFKEKEMQRKYLQIQLSKEQFSNMLSEKTLIEERLTEIAGAMESLEKIKDLKQGQEIWTPIGSGSFIESDITNVKEVAIGIGAGVIVKKKIEDASELLKSRLDILVSINNQFSHEINKLAKQIEASERELEGMLKEKQEGIGG